eukprot:TRINITY_DN4851_c4_g1_i2.p1 TRINITY_DN4851_c4_g1~~TRINITY_DN4851_c4_g1_i2.p1  ORF type:complete len:231 (+),score=31.72 TRINITY_DN4851_c4_g1_i2:56-694(+)
MNRYQTTSKIKKRTKKVIRIERPQIHINNPIIDSFNPPKPELFSKLLKKTEGEHSKEVAEYMNAINESIYDLAISYLQKKNYIKGDQTILEIGPGNGLLAHKFTDLGLLYVGMDYSGDMISTAYKNNKQLLMERKAQFIEGSVSSMPFSEGLFDLVFTSQTIYFWPDPVNDLKSVIRACKNGTKICIGYRKKSYMQTMPVFRQDSFKLYTGC